MLRLLFPLCYLLASHLVSYYKRRTMISGNETVGHKTEMILSLSLFRELGLKVQRAALLDPEWTEQKPVVKSSQEIFENRSEGDNLRGT